VREKKEERESAKGAAARDPPKNSPPLSSETPLSFRIPTRPVGSVLWVGVLCWGERGGEGGGASVGGWGLVGEGWG
jgi:hypothetical protein